MCLCSFHAGVLRLPLDSTQAKDFKQFSDEMQGMGKSAEDNNFSLYSLLSSIQRELLFLRENDCN